MERKLLTTQAINQQFSQTSTHPAHEPNLFDSGRRSLNSTQQIYWQLFKNIYCTTSSPSGHLACNLPTRLLDHLSKPEAFLLSFLWSSPFTFRKQECACIVCACEHERQRENKGWDIESNGPWGLTPSMPSLSFLKENLQLISLHCKDRPQFPEGTLLNIYARPVAKTLIKNICSSKDPSETHQWGDRIKRLRSESSFSAHRGRRNVCRPAPDTYCRYTLVYRNKFKCEGAQENQSSDNEAIILLFENCDYLFSQYSKMRRFILLQSIWLKLELDPTG